MYVGRRGENKTQCRSCPRLSSFCLARPVPRYLLVSRNGKEALCQWGAYVGGVDVVCFPFR